MYFQRVRKAKGVFPLLLFLKIHVELERKKFMKVEDYFLPQTLPTTIQTEEDFLQAFRWSDRARLILPKNITFPLKFPYYYSWVESSGTYAFLLLKRPNWEAPKGLVFRRNVVSPPTSNICNWCHTFGGSDDIGMMSVVVDSKQTVGLYICLNLDCLAQLETQIGSSGKSFETLAEQVCDKAGVFFEHVLIKSQ
jgi:hypothetical protein